MCFEHSAINCRSTLAKNMALYVLISEHTSGVHIIENPNEIIKARVEFPKALRPQAMRFSPVGAPSVPNENTLESFKQFSVRNIETVGSMTMTSDD